MSLDYARHLHPVTSWVAALALIVAFPAFAQEIDSTESAPDDTSALRRYKSGYHDIKIIGGSKAADAGHVAAEACLVRDMIKGNRGFSQIFTGIVRGFGIVWKGWRLSRSDPMSEKLRF